MFRQLLLAALGAALFTATASAQSAPTVTNPGWLVRPNAQSFEENYPPAAVTQGVEGYAHLSCAVLLDTRADCTLLEERPEGWGFGAAALTISQTFRMTPPTRNGEPVLGGVIRVPLRFHMYGQDTVTRPPGVTDEEWALWSSLAPDLPSWSDAPNVVAVNEAYPLRAREAGVRGRAVLSCRVRGDRRLNCTRLLETPAGYGFGDAAMSLVSRFEVAERERVFMQRYRSDPFLLPMNFGMAESLTPLNVYYDGAGPIEFPTVSIAPPPGVPAAEVREMAGEATIACRFDNDPPARCEIERASPPDWFFAQTALAGVQSTLPATQAEMIEYGIVAGDEVRITFRYGG